MTNTKLLLDQFKKSLKTLHEVLKQAENVYVRDSTIQRFEYTYELAWKSVKVLLRNRGLIIKSPYEAFKEAFVQGVIEYDQLWIKMIEVRNSTSHAYKENLAILAYKIIPKFALKFDELVVGLEAEVNKKELKMKVPKKSR